MCETRMAVWHSVFEIVIVMKPVTIVVNGVGWCEEEKEKENEKMAHAAWWMKGRLHEE